MVIDVKEQIRLLNVRYSWIAVKHYKHFQKQNMIPEQGLLRDHRCEGTNMAYKCKISEAVT